MRKIFIEYDKYIYRKIFMEYDKYIHQVYVSIAFSVSIHVQLVFIRRNHNIVIENDSELMTCYTVHYNI